MALSSGNVILVDDFRMKEEDCTETGMVWLDRNDGSCFYLKQSSGDENYKDRDEEFYGNLVDKYNFNLADCMYPNSHHPLPYRPTEAQR